MARAKANFEFNSFVRGLITEASPLTFPENASFDEDNFVLNREGSRQRRLGMDYEEDYVKHNTGLTALTFPGAEIGSYKWDYVANNASLSFGVIQVENKLWFFDVGQNVVSANIANSGNPITLQYTYSSNQQAGPLQYTSINGELIAASDHVPFPQRIAYTQNTDSFSTSTINLYVRDIWGVDDGLEVDERPTTLSLTHKYNLLNQGWTIENIDATFSELGVYPSNADVMHLAKDDTETFDPTLLDKQVFGTTPAAKGKFILNAFSRGGSRANAIGSSDLALDQELGNLTTVAMFAGRLFFAGVVSNITGEIETSPNYTGTIFFTQIADNHTKYGKCYQEADPTSEHDSLLVPTDGGTIQIPEAQKIFKLIPLGASLIVCAENGIWEISGPDSSFRADDFFVRKITNVGVVNAESVVEIEGLLMYWSQGGIYILQPDQVTGAFQSISVSDTTIQTFYENIPTPAKINSKGVYDVGGKKVRWLYNDSDDYEGTTFRFKYNRELVFDVVLQAFYTSTIYSIGGNSPIVSAFLPTGTFNTVIDIQSVVVNGEQVQVNGEDVVVSFPVRGRGQSKIKYVAFVYNGSTYDLTISNYNNASFADWQSEDGAGVDAPAYLITGQTTFNDTQRRKQLNNITFHFKQTESGFIDDGEGNLTPITPSGCLVRARWEWADSSVSGKWGTQFQAYALKRFYFPTGAGDGFDYGHSVVTTKRRIRGSGRSLSLRFDSEPGKDLYLYGWAYSVEGPSNV